MKPGGKAKYEGYCEKLLKLFNENKPTGFMVPDMHLKLYAEDDKIIAKFLIVLPEMMNPTNNMNIPTGMKEALKDVD